MLLIKKSFLGFHMINHTRTGGLRVVGKIVKLERSFSQKTFQLNDPLNCSFQLNARRNGLTY